MKEILNELKKKYLIFDKSKSNKNFIFKSYNLTNINNDYSIKDNININVINSNDILLANKLSENKFSKKYKIRNETNLYDKPQKTTPILKFNEMYNESMRKIFRNRIKKKLPDLKNITNSSNLIIQKIRRHVFFTEENYPYSLNDNEYGYKTLRTREKKDILKENNKSILEQIDNEEYMSKIKLLYNEELMNKEKIYFHEKSKYINIIRKLIKEINTFKYDKNFNLTKEYYAKRDYKTYLAGKLSINSVIIKIINIKNNQETNIVLPFGIIPFYLSLPRKIFYFFISKILSFNKNCEKLENGDSNTSNEIIINEKLLERYLIIIALNNQLFDNKAILFDDKKLIKESFYLFIDEKVYSLTIIPPFIELTKNEEKVKIQKIISKGLWLYLFQNNYNNWDEICLIYLYSFNIFRQIQFSSIKFCSNEILNLNIDDKNNKNDYIPKIKNIDRNICFYAYLNNEENKYDNQFFFISLSFYSLDQIYSKQLYKLYFSLEQSKILYSLSKQDNNLLSILYKCSLEKEEHKGINLNFPLIKDIQKGKIQNFIYHDNIKNKIFNNKKVSKSYKNKYNYKKGLKIKLNLPTAEIYEINKEKKIINQTFEIKEEILKKMIELNLIEMLKEIINFVINNYNLDQGKMKTNEKKSFLRANTQRNIQFNNKLKKKDVFFERNSNFNKSIHTKIFKK